jgi:hypothetical protein
MLDGSSEFSHSLDPLQPFAGDRFVGVHFSESDGKNSGSAAHSGAVQPTR